MAGKGGVVSLTVSPPVAVAGEQAVLCGFFQRSVRRWPDAVAVEVPAAAGRPRRTMSYVELDRRSDRIAGVVQSALGRRTVAAILVARTTEQLYAAQLGVLKSGSAYVCIDPAFPDQQLRHILADSAAGVLLTDADADGARRAARIGYAGTIIRLEQPPTGGVGAPLPGPTPDSVAYLIYTSGTTGRPKGVMISHRGICNLVGSDLVEFGLGPGDRVAQGSSPAYDSSVEEVWLALASGATVVVMNDDTARLGPDLVAWLRTERITVLCPPPTLLRATGCADPRRELPELRLLYVGGEALPEDVAARWAPGRRMVNGYGPTECTVTCLRCDVVAGQPVAIGRPIPGVTAWVLDADLIPVPNGQLGELCIGGAGLAVGYHNQPELTAAKFVQHHRLGRIYRTGDLVHTQPDGTIFYHGRIDSQVKLRGYRIELEAIEARLAGCRGVREAACRVEGDGMAQVLTAHVVVTDAADPPDVGHLKAELHQVLPGYMVPAFIGTLAELPRNASGKLRRDALPRLAGVGHRRADAKRAPRDPVERTIERALRRVLAATDAIGVDDDFFEDLGGSSLQAAMLITELRADPVTAGLTVRDLYATRTVARFAALVAATDDPPPGAPAGVPATNAPAVRPSAAAKASRRGRHAASEQPVAGATLAQAAWLLFGLLVAAPLAYLVVFSLLPAVSRLISLTTLILLLPVVAGVARPVFAPVSIGFAVLAKKVLIGRYAPDRIPVWSGRYVRMWLVGQLVRVVPWSTIAGTELQCVALRALGARIGQRVHIHRGVDLTRGGWDLLDIGDDVTISQDAAVRPLDLSEGHVVLGPVTIDRGATLGIRAGMGPNTRLGHDCVLSALSSLPTGVTTGDAQVWDGVPARPVAAASLAPTVTAAGRVLTPTVHGLAMVLSRTLLNFLLILPGTLASVALCAWLGIDYAYLLAMVTHPLAHVWQLVAATALLCLSQVTSVALEAVAVRTLGTLHEEVISRWSLTYLKVWLKTDLVNSAGDWLSGGLFWPTWLRWAGMTVGGGCEISTIIDVVPELVEIGPDTFFADGIYLGGPRIQQGAVTLARVQLGGNTFLGNHAVIPAGQRLPGDILIGVCTVADDRTVRAGTSWFGHPAFELPRREVVACDPSLTHRPSQLRLGNRLFWEWLRFTLPTVPMLALVGWAWGLAMLRGVLPLPALLAIGAPAVTLASAGMLCLFVLALKWALLGRVRPGTHPLWSCWCSRWDFLYVAWGFIAGPVLSTLDGTLLLHVYLRAMGMKIGKRVVLGDGFAQVVDPDMIEICDGATVNAMFQAHTFEDRVLKIDRVRVGANSTLADATVPLYGADIGKGTYVAPHSVVMKHEHLLAGHRYEGVPTADQRH
jgi:non-ribosomal peptide synthetase-like protein